MTSITTLLVAACMFSLVPRADAAFGIMPMEAEQKLPVSNRVTDDIEVHNGGEETLFISGSVQDWDLNRTGDYAYAEAGSHDRSCAPWIQLNPAQFTVAPGKSVRVRYTITAPAAIDKTHWAMIFFQSRPLPMKDAPQLGLMVSTRVGCKVLLAPQKAEANTGEIVDMAVQSPDTKPLVKVVVRNPGRNIYRARGTAKIKNAAGETVAKAPLIPAQLLPGHTRDLQLALPQLLPSGSYTLEAQIDVGAAALIGGELSFKVPSAQ